MRVAIIGGGPAGLYLGILLRLADPRHTVTVVERNRPDDTFGWGVVFSDQTLENFRAADPPSHQRIIDRFAHWDDIDIHVKGEVVTSGGHGFCGIARRELLGLLQARAGELGVDLRFDTEVSPEALLKEPLFRDADLIVAADGINSRIREAHAGRFGPDLEQRRNRYIWLGTKQPFDAFKFIFKETEHGWFWVHAYRFDRETSTFIVETSEESWRRAGFDAMDREQGIAMLEQMFAEYLGGQKLMSNARHLRGSAWLNFVRVSNRTWRHGRIVLMGDAAHTAHFSIGSGTKLAMEDAIALAKHLRRNVALGDALRDYEDERRVEVLRLQSAARNSTEWFENVDRYRHLEPTQFAYSLLTRSQRVSHENLRQRDASYLSNVERWFAGRAGANSTPQAAPMFQPFTLRGVTLANRVVVSPMAMYSAVDGAPGDFHLVHLGARAMGGAGLVFTEMTCVAPDARITPGCAGLYTDAHVAAWKRIVDFMHANSRAKVAIQLGHAGRKGSTRLGWEGYDEPLPQGNWKLFAPSSIPYGPQNQTPHEMTRADMDGVRDAFVAATRRAVAAGFDWLELHMAHGYLLSGFITPISNTRTDDYGGSMENRLRFPLEVFDAVRAAWPREKPISVRLSATDWVEGGIDGDQSVAIARLFKARGCDLIDVSAGQTSRDAKPVYGRMFQTPFSDRIRNEAGIATMAVGNITDFDQVNGILAAGRADLCALARPHLSDPHWTLRAAAGQGFAAQPWPPQYLAGKEQMERQRRRASGTRVSEQGPV
ncbi:MAG: bifunctional salicylyl-CoA 5-hydroxylase/oxidoreductase [Alphaproteobacteria bacterium]|nr:bifunctional salicylyl-CoA 5-hydroxylase/oxidoreductase [Alphaproteobacteria bacterium]